MVHSVISKYTLYDLFLYINYKSLMYLTLLNHKYTLYLVGRYKYVAIQQILMYVEREIIGAFLSAARLNSIVVIVGPRQSGKTTFLKAQSKNVSENYLSFDDPDVRELFDTDIKRFENQYLFGNSVVVLDEIQYGKGPGSKLKYLADKGKKLWVTSSSQVALDKEVLGWLVGRASVIALYPFSLNEVLRSDGQNEVTPSILKRTVEKHIIYGGYPKVVLEKDNSNKETMLKDLYQLMIFKDVARTFNIGDTAGLERLAQYLSHSVGNLLSYEALSRELGLSSLTVKRYVDAMEKSYLIVRVPPLFRNKLKEIVKQHKLYFVDTGMRNAVANSFYVPPEIKGKLLENYIFSELIKAGEKVKYWQSKNNAEVDFVVQHGGELIPIEVKVKVDGKHLIGRSLQSFIEAYEPKRGFVVFYEGESSASKYKGCSIGAVNVKDLLSALKKWKPSKQDVHRKK